MSLETDILGSMIYTDVKVPVTVFYRCLKIERGCINNPEWAASPFDVAQQADLVELAEAAPLMLGIREEIPNNANIDAYLTPGAYACRTDAAVPTLSGLPSGLTNAFTLDVKYTTGKNNPSYISQTLTTYNSSVEYIRERANSTSWRPWRQTYKNVTVRPIEGGGTGASTVEGAKQNLGITALEARVTALESYL